MTSCDVIIFVFSPLPGNTFSDALAASYVMATDSSKWDITMFLNMCKDTRFKPEEVTFSTANELLQAVSEIVKVVS
jgi:hypothetical protein